MRYRCENCGASHESNSPPCLECAGESLVPEDEYVDTGEETETATTAPRWRCEGCGKVHSRHNPPCSRCGTMQFTNDPNAEIDQGVPTGGGNGSKGALWYASRAAAVVAVVIVLLAGNAVVTGDPTGTQLFSGAPGPIEVAGADDSYEGANLTAIERGVAAGINDRRSGPALDWSPGLHEAAEYHNHRAVKNDYRGWARDDETVLNDVRSFGADCGTLDGTAREYGSIGDRAFVETGTESEVAATIVEELWGHDSARSGLERPLDRIGVDLFVTERGETLLVLYVC